MSPFDAVQLAPGLFECQKTETNLGSVRVRQCAYNVGVRGTIQTADSKLYLAYLPRQRGIARLGGEPWLNRRLAVLRGSVEFCADQACLLSLIEFDPRQLPLVAGSAPPAEKFFAMLPTDDFDSMRVQERADTPLQTSEPAERSAAERVLVASIVRVVEKALRPENRVRRYEQRQAVAAAAERYMWSHIDDDIGLPEICRAIECNARTLINYFNSLYGMSPIRFLKVLRLNGAQRALRGSDPRNVSIFDVAADHGFWHLGHFSSDYRFIFGETPSETLQSPSRERMTPVLR